MHLQFASSLVLFLSAGGDSALEKQFQPADAVVETEQQVADVGHHGLQDQTASAAAGSATAEDNAQEQADVAGHRDGQQAEQQAAVGASTSVQQLSVPSTSALPAVMQEALAGRSLDDVVAQ
jgi:hypothetical protein